ncbi:TIGR01244 family sulfur transferase [Citreimonas salinaria]|uniref:TIGR01244 family protein n=1 Tax=Citreimonas salinaria TaxID=321339 RepID=A0A1H3JQ57_9RHOB|nr:TIGR01244 family sulfur transferase [Citreimonas salinaria]SDY41508.1 TIGR01244 family protein [Citreimonas salinaria]
MDARQITDRYAVSPQIEPEDAAALRDAGFATVICNRPDAEVPPALQADAIGAAMRAAGLRFEVLPITHQTLTPENAARQAQIIEESEGPVLAYCASGTRSTFIWALGAAGKMSADDIVAAGAQAGYDLSPLRPTIAAASARG